MTPRYACIYGRCKMVNLCKGSHCVGAGLDADGYKIDGFGNIVEKTEADYDGHVADAILRLVSRPTE